MSLVARADQEVEEVVRACVDHGLDWIDTADVYCSDEHDLGANERQLGRALRSLGVHAASLRVVTKGGLTRPGGEWGEDGSPARLRRQCEASLRNLGLEVLPLYQLHAPDPLVPLEDSVGALARLREEGKVLHVGLSNVSVEDIDRACAVTTIASVQNRASLLAREAWDDGVLAACRARGITFLAYSPVGGPDRALLHADPVVQSIAARHGLTPEGVALAWLLTPEEDGHGELLAIPGASRATTVREIARATRARLEPAERAALAARTF
jgi:aryl-alcohol dehydrogenase-like predicted oxidoreductase